MYAVITVNTDYYVVYKWQDGNGVVRGNYLSVFLELFSGLPETSKFVHSALFYTHHILVYLGVTKTS